MIEQHIPRPTAALRARIPAGRQIAACAAALALALPVGMLAGRALAPDAPGARTGTSHVIGRQELTRDLATLAVARAAGRAELRGARTPSAQEQAALRLAHAYDDAALALSAAPGVMVDALIAGLSRTEEAYAGLARAAKLRAAARFAAARRDVKREEARLAAAFATATASASHAADARAPAASGTPLAILVLVLGLAAAGLTAAPRRRRSPARPSVPRRAASPEARAPRRTPATRAAAPTAPRAAAPTAPRAAAPTAPRAVAPTAPPAAAPTAPPAAAPTAPRASSATGWTCEIAWTAGRRGAGFHVVAAAPGRQRRLIARSANLPSLPFLPPIPEGETLAAARALARRLLLAGWTPTTRERQWYAQRFEWTGEADPEPLPAGRDPVARPSL